MNERTKAMVATVWRFFDGLYGGDGRGNPLPYDLLPPDRQQLADEAIDALSDFIHEESEETMGTAYLSPPGSRTGPCKEQCEHTDCAQTREMANSPCPVCLKPIGYGQGFYAAPQDLLEPGVRWVHAACYEGWLHTR